MRGNTIKLRMSDKSVEHVSGLYQYDYGQRLVIEGVELPSVYEVHFSNQERGSSKTRIGDSSGVDIPDEYLLSGENIHVWIFLHNAETDGETEYHGIVHVHTRAKPSDLEPTPVQQDVITQTIAALNDAVNNVNEIADGIPDAIDEALTEAKESGEFDGYSPRATVTKEGRVVTIEITDKKGTTSATVSEPDPVDLIDDTAGAGVTDKSWSADKLTSELNQKALKNNPEFTGSISMGRKNETSVGGNSVALGYNVEASEVGSFAEGYNTIAAGVRQHVFGENNVPDSIESWPMWDSLGETAYHVGDTVKVVETDETGTDWTIAYTCIQEHSDAKYPPSNSRYWKYNGKSRYVLIVGNGTDSNRSNAFALGWDGNGYFAGDVYVGCDAESGEGNKVAVSDNPQFTGSISLNRKADTDIGDGSVSVGDNNEASGRASFAEGYNTTSDNLATHAEGLGTNASGVGSHAQGGYTTSTGLYSHAEGYNSETSGDWAHAGGYGTVANASSMTAIGKSNVPATLYPEWEAGKAYSVGDKILQNGAGYVCTEANSDSDFNFSKWSYTGNTSDELFVIGNGGNNSLERSNAMMVDIGGNARLSGDIYVQTETDSSGGYKLMSEANVATVEETLEIIREYNGVGV